MDNLKNIQTDFSFQLSYALDDLYVGTQIEAKKYEPYETKLFLSYVHGDSVVLDIGANIGYYSLIAAERVMPGVGHIYSFEPSQETFSILEKNIFDNHKLQIEAVHAAIGELDGTGSLYHSKENKGDHRVFASDETRTKEDIIIRSIDSFLQEKNIQPTIIKIDTQGFDLAVLRGMKKFLSTPCPLVLFTEFWNYGTTQAGLSSEEYFDFLCTHFRTIHLIQEEASMIVPASYEQIMELCTLYEGKNHVNLLCLR